MTELEHIAELERELQSVFELAASARDEAQKALSEIIEMKARLTRRQIELLKQQQAVNPDGKRRGR